ncbi:hypothetical protein BU61_9045 [Pontoporia blainvillei]|uniref:Uncharacterized protein n=1 Tax=Pontoporia blainvillei TaxID=48723 RepID=A0ABX0SAG3_PONBL|nr:hypothetical protein [Pontoporia blainvillei]
MVRKLKHKSNLLELSVASIKELLGGSAIPGLKHSIASTIFMPSSTLPKTTGLPSNHSVLAVQVKNWEQFVLSPAFAMDKILGPICFRMKRIIKFHPAHGLATSAIIACEVTTLVHKTHDNSVKAGTFTTKSIIPSVQGMKVFCCLCNFVSKQLERDVVQGLTADSDVEEHNSGVDCGWVVVMSAKPNFLHSLVQIACPPGEKSLVFLPVSPQVRTSP